MKKGQQQTVPNVLYRLAEVLGTEVNDRRLEIPEKFGTGYYAGSVFNEHIRMLICNYELNEDLIVNNPDINATINIEVDADYLNGLFDSAEKSPVLKSLLQNTKPLLFEQMVYPSLQNIVDEIVTESVDETFKLFFLRVKAEELICRLLMELEKRDETHLYALNSHDIGSIYKVKEQMLEHLEIPPVIKELAVLASMSPSQTKTFIQANFRQQHFQLLSTVQDERSRPFVERGKAICFRRGLQAGLYQPKPFFKSL